MTTKFRVLLILMVGLATLGMASCGHYTCGLTFGNSTCGAGGTGITSSGGTTTGSGAAFVYFVDVKDGGMALEILDMVSPTSFTDISNFVPPTLPSGPKGTGGVVVDTKFLYIPCGLAVCGFSIDGTTGALTAVPNSPNAVLGAYSVAADPAGRFLFVSDFANDIAVFTINSTDGSLIAVAGSPFTTPVKPSQMTTDGKGRYLYEVQGYPGSEVGAFSYDQTTGALTAVPGSPFAFNMAEITGEASGNYLLGITGGLNGGTSDKHVYVFSIAQTGSALGAIVPVTGSPFATTYTPINLTVSPSGAFVYTFNQEPVALTFDPMEGFSLSSAGALAALDSSPFTSFPAQVGQFEQSGQYMIAVAEAANIGVSTFPYALDSTTGALTSTISPLGDPGTFVVTDAP
jgi:hypothetical protein